MQKSQKTGPFPSFFRGSLVESRTSTYARAGWTLAIHIRNLLAYEIEDPDGAVDRALGERDPAAGLWRLIETHMPRCSAAVPRRRRGTFVRGLAEAIEAERV